MAPEFMKLTSAFNSARINLESQISEAREAADGIKAGVERAKPQEPGVETIKARGAADSRIVTNDDWE
jgi:hypothetical protein